MLDIKVSIVCDLCGKHQDVVLNEVPTQRAVMARLEGWAQWKSFRLPHVISCKRCTRLMAPGVNLKEKELLISSVQANNHKKQQRKKKEPAVEFVTEGEDDSEHQDIV
jgi:hypothetical protein